MQNKMIGELKVKEAELQRIREIEKTVNNIDRRYFVYDEQNKKHIINIDFTFASGSYDFFTTAKDVRPEFIQAGKAIINLLNKFPKEQNIKYQIVIEGQSSKDGYNIDEFRNNDVLSFHRAQALLKLWKESGINIDEMDNCELVIAGSGEKGKPRFTNPDEPPHNQRFLISIIPKIGQLRNK
jgi:flagellar motor protein MotB